MLNKTRAIVLHKTNYSETSIIVQAYSLHYGKISLLIQGVKKKKSRNKSALFEPLSIIEFVANFKDVEKLVRPREIKLYYPFVSIQNNIPKRLIALFLSEVLHKSIREPHPEESMYFFIEKSLLFLESSDSHEVNFHLVFLVKLTKYLGFYPMVEKGEYFDMTNGVFSNQVPQNTLYLQGENKEMFYSVLGMEIDDGASFGITNEQRRAVLGSIIDYYNVHIPGMGEIKSHHILETIFG